MSSDGHHQRLLVYHGSNFLRQRLVLSTLSGKPVKIVDIRSDCEEPGLKEYEASFIKLLEKLCNGSEVIINHTGTKLIYKPGILIGGAVNHDCCTERSIGYYIEAILCLVPFCKTATRMTLNGVTNDNQDPSVDIIKMVTLKLMEQFGINEGLELTINKRGSIPNGGGEVVLCCPVVRQLQTISLLTAGKVKKIRGLCYSTRVSPAIANRIVDSCRNVFNSYLSDVYIYVDHCKSNRGGRSPGFGVSLTATTTTGVMYAAQLSADSLKNNLPEDIGKTAAYMLLEEIAQGSCVDSRHQSIALLMMALGPPDVNRVRTGPLTNYSIELLRHLRDFYQLVFKIDTLSSEDDNPSLRLSCIGINYTNIGKKTL